MKFYKEPVFIAITAIVIIGGIFFCWYFSDNQENADFVVIKKGDIVSEVSVTGKVKPAKNVDLAFEKSGKILFVGVDVGNYVRVGDTLVREDSSELFAQLEKAKADLETQKADLDKSNVVLNNYYLAIPDILNDAYIKADDAAKKQTGAMFTDAESDTPRLNFSSTNSQAVTDSQNGRLASRTELSVWRSELDILDISSNEVLAAALVKSKTHLSVISLFLTNLAAALEKAAGLSQSTLDSYKAAITTARTNVNTAITSITGQGQDINAQKANVASEEVAVESYEAGIKNIQAQINKTVIYAPISGMISQQNAKVGEIAAANTVLVSIISASQFEAEANVPEVDIAKIKVGSLADIILDAYGNSVVFEAKVSKIDPAETIIEGVSTYKTTLQFLKIDNRIKSGLTGNVDILSEKHTDVLTLPARFVWIQDGNKFVTIIDSGGRTKNVEVKMGLRGSDGNVEITEGLNEGDKVVAHTGQ